MTDSSDGTCSVPAVASVPSKPLQAGTADGVACVVFDTSERPCKMGWSIGDPSINFDGVSSMHMQVFMHAPKGYRVSSHPRPTKSPLFPHQDLRVSESTEPTLIL